MTLSERAQYLLKILIERYIREGLPVGSRTLAEESHMALSPATIRNELAELEERGFLISPHTSAGRIPTAQGYRLYVDTLITIHPFKQIELEKAQQQLNPDLDLPTLASSASNLLSGITNLIGLVTLPPRESLILQQLEFLPLSGNRVLVILVFNDREVQNRIINTDRNYSREELQQCANYFNERYAGGDLPTVRKKLLSAMQEDRYTVDRLMQAAVNVAEKAVEEPSSDKDYVLAGQTHVLNWAEEGGVERLRQLFDAFNQKRDVLDLLDRCLESEGIQIFIGSESGHSALDACSIVVSPYTSDDKVVGVMAVVGPTRMPYDRVISVVDATSKLLSAALNLPK